MPSVQLAGATTVVSFAAHAARKAGTQGVCLTPQDRMQVSIWQDKARLAGYDRMVIHDRDEGDASEVGSFLSVHRSGQAWSRWGFARAGARIRVWCSLTGADAGDFASLSEALQAVLLNGEPGPKPASVTNLVPLGARFGSAA